MAALQSQRDEPGTQREYETIYIVRPDAETTQIRDVNQRVRRVIEEADGRLLRVENWGKRKLAYELKKQNRGIYLYFRYLSPPQLITELERNLRMVDTVLRYMTVKIDENVDVSARPSDFNDEDFEAAAETAPDEEDLFLRMGRDRTDGETRDDDADDTDDDEYAAGADDDDDGEEEAAPADEADEAAAESAEEPTTSEDEGASEPEKKEE